jgi:hypothetical protein
MTRAPEPFPDGKQLWREFRKRFPAGHNYGASGRTVSRRDTTVAWELELFPVTTLL